MSGVRQRWTANIEPQRDNQNMSGSQHDFALNVQPIEHHFCLHNKQGVV
jgi:hypothetical protein